MNERMTVKEAAEAKGLDFYDTALPQSWLNAVMEYCPIEPVGNVVWCYKWKEFESLGGIPVAITKEGEILLSMIASTI